MDEKETDWGLASSDMDQYKQHIQTRIQKDLHESMSHLTAHMKELEAQVSKLNLAKDQIQSSVANSREQVQQSCCSMLELLTTRLMDRQTELLCQLDKLEQQSMAPLLQCESVLQEAVQRTLRLQQTGKALADGKEPPTDTNTSSNCEQTTIETSKPTLLVSRDRIAKFQKEAALDNCLPSVPELHAVVCVSVAFPPLPLAPLLSSWGAVSQCGPVQLTNIEERPGALLLQWEEVSAEDDEDEDYCADECGAGGQFVVQCSAAGDTDPASASYSTVYTGTDDSFLLQRLCVGERYWLRVTRTAAVPALPCGCPAPASEATDATQQLEPWSLPRECRTTLPHYRWQTNSPSWRVADEGRLASRVEGEGGVLCSSGAVLTPPCCLTLQVVSAAVGCSNEGVALCWRAPTAPMHLTAPGALFISADGSVVVDGQQRLMRLPALQAGSSVTFTLEHRNTDRLRVTIETEDKQVTYEWSVKATSEPQLYFSACFDEPLWSIRCC